MQVDALDSLIQDGVFNYSASAPLRMSHGNQAIVYDAHLFGLRPKGERLLHLFAFMPCWYVYDQFMHTNIDIMHGVIYSGMIRFGFAMASRPMQMKKLCVSEINLMSSGEQISLLNHKGEGYRPLIKHI